MRKEAVFQMINRMTISIWAKQTFTSATRTVSTSPIQIRGEIQMIITATQRLNSLMLEKTPQSIYLMILPVSLACLRLSNCQILALKWAEINSIRRFKGETGLIVMAMRMASMEVSSFWETTFQTNKVGNLIRTRVESQIITSNTNHTNLELNFKQLQLIKCPSKSIWKRFRREF